MRRGVRPACSRPRPLSDRVVRQLRHARDAVQRVRADLVGGVVVGRDEAAFDPYRRDHALAGGAVGVDVADPQGGAGQDRGLHRGEGLGGGGAGEGAGRGGGRVHGLALRGRGEVAGADGAYGRVEQGGVGGRRAVGDRGGRGARRGAVGVGAGDQDVALGGLGGRGVAHRPQAVEELVGRGLGGQHRRGEAAQPQGGGAAVGEDLGEQRVVVTADVRGGRADPQPAVLTGHVLDQVGERLGYGRAGVGGEELLEFGGGAAGVQGAAHGTRREAVDRRAALGLDVGEHAERVGERAAQRAGGDGGQVRLEEDVIDGFGEEGGEDGGGAGRGGVGVRRWWGARRVDAASIRARPWVESAPRPVTPSNSASVSAHWARRERRSSAGSGEDAAAAGPSPAVAAVGPVDRAARPRRCAAGAPSAAASGPPVAGTDVPGGRVASRARARRRTSGAGERSRCGPRAASARPLASAVPTTPGVRVAASQPAASTAQRSWSGSSQPLLGGRAWRRTARRPRRRRRSARPRRRVRARRRRAARWCPGRRRSA